MEGVVPKKNGEVESESRRALRCQQRALRFAELEAKYLHVS